MSNRDDPNADRFGGSDKLGEHPPPEQRRHGHWLMIACCIPMLALAVILVAAGAPIGTLVIAIACLTLMGFMMIGMTRA
ncbi:MAG: hypothetical protein BroJett024_43370 [Alphaproteobacteria bacterium]|nr:MAG: hypothetical protein BroJett024_43370 [Alphaproteobacteria bacterium]